MATFTVTIPDAALNDIIDAVCDQYAWNQSLGITKANFTKQKVGQFLTASYITYKAKQASTSAAEQAAATAAPFAAQVTVV